MNEEIEIQVILKNPEQVEVKLKEIAKFIKEKTQKDEYFVPKHEDFFAPEMPIRYLRVRHEDGNDSVSYHFLHFEEDNEELDKTDEYTTKVEDPKMMSIILKKLDMTNSVTVTKHRKYFDYKDFEILIDHIEELGYFMEVEAKKPLGSLKETKKECYKILEEIEAKWETPKIRGYPRMILKNQGGN